MTRSWKDWTPFAKKTPTLSVQAGLYQIGAQAYHILLRESLSPHQPVVLLVPTAQKRQGHQHRSRSFDRRNSTRSDEYDDWDSRFMLRTEDDFGDRYNEVWGPKSWFRPSCIPISIILVLIVLVVLLPLLDAAEKRSLHPSLKSKVCQENCTFSLVESIPLGVKYPNETIHESTYSVWSRMLKNAEHSIDIASYYWTLTTEQGSGHFPGTQEGKEIFSELLSAGKMRKIKVRIVQSEPTVSLPNTETEILAKKGKAEVRTISMPRLVGGGVMHTKLWIVDGREIYVGSSNTDWRSLTQVKELGVYIANCSCIVEDVMKLFDVYWSMGVENAQIPSKWPEKLSTDINAKAPLVLNVNSNLASVYISTSPPQFCPEGRTTDVDGILDVIDRAESFVYIAVMDYFPLMIYTPKAKFWPVIDDALKRVAIENGVEVRLLMSLWNHTRPSAKLFLNSLRSISGSYKNVKISAKWFQVPSDAEQSQIPFARVNHNKYMVTDSAAFIGTSNWSGDYFTNTAGIGVIVSGETSFRDELEEVFLRDWNSVYAIPVEN